MRSFEIDVDRTTPLGVLALVAATLSLLLLAASLRPPPATPAQWLAFASEHRTAYALFASLVLAWSVFSVPLIVALAAMLRTKGGTLVAIAQVLSAIGVLLLAFAIFANIGAVLSILAATPPLPPQEALYHAAIWFNLGFYLTDPGLMAWGLGQFIFGYVALRSGVLPDWLAVVGMLGGVAGLLTLAVYQTGVLALVQLLCFAVWGFATAFSLLRARRERTVAVR